MPTGNFNGYGMWGGGWGELAPQMPTYAQQAKPIQGGGQSAYGAPQIPMMQDPFPVSPVQAPQMGGFAPPDLPFQASPVAMQSHRPADGPELRMNRFGNFAQRFAL